MGAGGELKADYFFECVGKIETTDDLHYVLDRLQQGRIHPEKLITHEYPLEEIIKGFEIMRDKKEEYVKVMGKDVI